MIVVMRFENNYKGFLAYQFMEEEKVPFTAPNIVKVTTRLDNLTAPSLFEPPLDRLTESLFLSRASVVEVPEGKAVHHYDLTGDVARFSSDGLYAGLPVREVTYTKGLQGL